MQLVAQAWSLRQGQTGVPGMLVAVTSAIGQFRLLGNLRLAGQWLARHPFRTSGALSSRGEQGVAKISFRRDNAGNLTIYGSLSSILVQNKRYYPRHALFLLLELVRNGTKPFVHACMRHNLLSRHSNNS